MKERSFLLVYHYILAYHPRIDAICERYDAYGWKDEGPTLKDEKLVIVFSHPKGINCIAPNLDDLDIRQ